MAMREKNPGAFDRLRARVRAIGGAPFRAELHQVLAAAAMTQLQNGFVQSRDPYGKPWQALTSRSGQPLRNRGASGMSGSAHVNQKPDGFSITLDQGHPKTHQTGMTIYPKHANALRFVAFGKQVFAKAVTIPQRMLFPVARRGLGLWGAPLNREVSSFMRRKLLGGAP